MRSCSNKNSEISIQVLFAILMVIFFVGIVFFGITKIIYVEDVIGEGEIRQIEKEILEVVERYCGNSLNRGSLKNIKIPTKNKFDTICILGEEFNGISDLDVNLKKQLYDSDVRVVLLKEEAVVGKVESSFEIANTFCFSENLGEGIIHLPIYCNYVLEKGFTPP